MATLEELEYQKAQAAQSLKTLSDSTEPGDWNDEVKEQWDSKFAEFQSIEAAIERMAKANSIVESSGIDAESRAIQAKRAEKIREIADRENISVDEATNEANEVRRVYVDWLRSGPDGITNAADWKRYQNTLVVGTDTAGGHTVPVETMATLLEVMKEFGGLRPVATIQSVSTGREINWPTQDATSQEGEIVAEDALATQLDPAFGQKTLKFDTYSSKEITISIELLQDSIIQLESLLVRLLAQRLARIQAKYMTVGSTGASHNVQGIVEDASLGYTEPSGGSANTGRTNIDFNSVLNLVHSLDPIYRVNGGTLMFNDTVLLRLKLLKDGDSRPLWLPGVAVGAPSTIYGYPYVVNQQMQSPAATTDTMLFGDFSNYVILDAMGMTTYRFAEESAYARRGRVGYLGKMRTAARLVDVNGESVKRFRQST